MNVNFLVRITNDPSEEEKFSILELSSSKNHLKALQQAYVKQFCDDHDTISINETEEFDKTEITYEWTEDEEPHIAAFLIVSGNTDVFFRTPMTK